MKNTVLLLVLLAGPACAQTAVNQTVPLKAGQQVLLQFDYPELIKVTTWDRQEISVTGSVSINGGESDDAFKLETGTEGNNTYVRNRMNLKGIPHRITVTSNGKKTVFRTKADFKQYVAENGKEYNSYSEGVDMDITLEIKVPANVTTRVESTYGMVEVREFRGPLEVLATYGGVDVAMNEKTTGELNAETNYGHIYSNLDLSFDRNRIREENFHTEVTAKPGTGPRYRFESKYGNVYLRKSMN